MKPVRLFLFAAFLSACLALECYSGESVIGVDIGMSTKTCSDYCYNITVDAINTKIAGCASSIECSLSQNDCIEKKYEGHGATYCCCNTGDLCNSVFTIGLYLPLFLMASLSCL